MSCNYTAYISDARALLLTEHSENVIVLCVYAAHACSFNYKSDYSVQQRHPLTASGNGAIARRCLME